MPDPISEDGDSRHWASRMLRRFLTGGEADQSLRAQLEEVIDDHEEDGGNNSAGDL